MLVRLQHRMHPTPRAPRFAIMEDQIPHYRDILMQSPSPRPKARGSIRDFIAASFVRWQRHRMIAALESLDDMLLDDIGITRAEIPQIATQVVCPRKPKSTCSETPSLSASERTNPDRARTRSVVSAP